jgi:hypothetical protein
MMRRLMVCVLLAAAGLTADDRLHACGDKFLVHARGSRFQRAGIARPPASVLLYANPASRLATSLEALAVPAALAKVGYTPTVVADAAALGRAIATGRHALVVVDLRDAGAVGAASGASVPAVVAVAFDVSGTQLKAARREHAAVLRGLTRPASLVDAVDEVLYARALRAGSRAD